MQQPETLIVDVAKAYALAEFYPLQHPTLAEALRRLEQTLIARGTEFTVEVLPGGLSTGPAAPPRRSPHLDRFREALAGHGVGRLSLDHDVGAVSLGRLLSGLALPARVAAAAGGLPAALAAAGVAGVRVDGERIVPARGDDDGETRPDEGLALWNTQDAYELVRASAERAESDDVDELRRRMHDGDESERLEVVQRLEMVVQRALQKGEMDRSIDLLDRLRADAERLAGTSPAVRGHVMLALHRLAGRAVVDEVVDRLCAAREDAERERLRSLLVHVGADSVTPLVRALTAADDRAARRNVRDALVALDAVGVPLIEEMVDDQRWFVVRNMVGILAEIRSADAVEHFARTIAHDDARVRRETIHALTKLGGEDAVPLLVRALGDPEAPLRSAAAHGLGLVKARAAVSPLLARLGQERDGEVVMEVVQALGRIGDTRAVPALAERAGGGGWLKRTPTELRVAAVRALGEIGDDSARDVLRKLDRDRTAEVREAVLGLLA